MRKLFGRTTLRYILREKSKRNAASAMNLTLVAIFRKKYRESRFPPIDLSHVTASKG